MPVHGHHFSADSCSGLVRSLRFDDGEVTDEQDWTDAASFGRVNSFGLDNDGELLASDTFGA